MLNLLLISYGLTEDSIKKEEHYMPVAEAIEKMGASEVQQPYSKVHPSVWYVFTYKTAKEVYDELLEKCSNEDKIFVIDIDNKNFDNVNIEPQKLKTQMKRSRNSIKKIVEGMSQSRIGKAKPK